MPGALPQTMQNGVFGNDPGGTGMAAATQAASQESQASDLEAAPYIKAYGLAMQTGDTESAAEFDKKIRDIHQKTDSKLNNPTRGVGDNVLSGIGRGLSASGALIPGQEFNPDTDKALMDTGGGKVGDFIGNTALTAPVGGAGGALAKAAGAATKGVPVLSSTLARYGGRAALAAGENAVATAADGGDAEAGAEAGATLSALGGAAGRFTRGVVKKSPLAQRLYADAGDDIHIPISQGADSGGLSGVAKGLYKEVLPVVPGVGGRLGKQAEAADNKIRQVMSDDVAPTGTATGDTQQLRAADIKQQYDDAYNRTVKSYAFNTPSSPDMQQKVFDHLNANPDLAAMPKSHKLALADTVDQVVQEYSENGTLQGINLLNAKKDARTALEALQQKTGKTMGGAAGVNAATASIDSIVDDEIANHQGMLTPKLTAKQRAPIQQTIDDLKTYQATNKQYSAGNAVMGASDKAVADRGDFTGKAIAQAAPDQTRLQRMGQDLHELQGTDSGKGSHQGNQVLRYTLGTLGAGAAVTGHGGALAAAIPAAGVAHTLASVPVQKMLYGDTAKQQALARFLRNNPVAAHTLGAVGRQGAIDATGQ